MHLGVHAFTLIIHLKTLVGGFPLEMAFWVVKVVAKIVNMP